MQAFDFNTPNTKYSLLLTPVMPSCTMEQALSQSVLQEASAVESADSEVETDTQQAAQDKAYFFHFFFASYPPKEADIDYQLRVDMQPLNVVFNETIVERICTFLLWQLQPSSRHKLCFIP